MRLRRTGIAVFTVVTLAVTAGLARHSRSPDVVVHEWGTFTSIAGVDGRAINWLPLSGPTDLPCFVDHLNGNVMAKLAPNSPIGQQVTFEQARTRLQGKVRMETPVIYFYSARDYDASVTVSFTRGIITEFYPTPTQPALPTFTNWLDQPGQPHSLTWNVRVSPDVAPLYPNGGTKSHYYAARATDATPLKSGAQTEKFIFYRGVASFDVPIQTRILPSGEVDVWNLSADGPLPAVILFESRNGRMGFRVGGEVARSVTLAPPALSADTSAIRAELRKELVRAGLYPKEAQAMLDTWNDSWFEEGSRVFYLVPLSTVDRILPLRIEPAPTTVARVFVGRMELVDAATQAAVKTALLGNDAATLDRYGRFLSPIADRIIASGADRATSEKLGAATRAAFAKYTSQLRACE